MEIQFNSNMVPVSGPIRKSPQNPAAQASQPSASFTGADALNQALQQAPESRAEVVQRAKELVAQNDYPPPELMNGLAKLLAAKLNSDTE
jgi:hypothetical protein